METKVTLTCSPRELDFIFSSGEYKHPEIPLFNFSVKSYEDETISASERPDIFVNPNAMHTYKVVIRHSEDIKPKTYFDTAIEFILHYKGTLKDSNCILTDYDQKKHRFKTFINGTVLSREQLSAMMKNHQVKLEKYPKDTEYMPERRVWNEAVAAAELTDLDGDSRTAYAAGYEAGIKRMHYLINKYMELKKDIEQEDNQVECLAHPWRSNIQMTDEELSSKLKDAIIHRNALTKQMEDLQKILTSAWGCTSDEDDALTVKGVRKRVSNKIRRILRSANLNMLTIADLDLDSSPIVQEDTMDENNTFTLDHIIVNHDNTISIDASSAWADNLSLEEEEMSTDVLLAIADFLQEHEDDIKLLSKEE